MAKISIIKQNRKFGCTIAIFLLCFIAYRLFVKHQQHILISTIPFLLLGLALIKPYWLNPLRLLWDKIGHVLGIINTYVLLTLFYCFILTPLGLIMLLLGKDTLNLKKSNLLDTYWEVDAKITGSKMENQF